MFVRVLQRNRTNRIYRETEIEIDIDIDIYIYIDLAHIVMEAEKSQDLLSTIWTCIFMSFFKKCILLGLC